MPECLAMPGQHALAGYSCTLRQCAPLQALAHAGLVHTDFLNQPNPRLVIGMQFGLKKA
jgi:hypothetical protein